MRQSCISNTLNQATLTISARRGCVARIERPMSLAGLVDILKQRYNDPLSMRPKGPLWRPRSVVAWAASLWLGPPKAVVTTRFVVGSALSRVSSTGVSYLRRYEERGYGTI